jgi:hypothetical protein
VQLTAVWAGALQPDDGGGNAIETGLLLMAERLVRKG